MFIHNPVQMLGFTSHLVELLDGMVNPDVHKRFTIDKVILQHHAFKYLIESNAACLFLASNW